MKKLLLLPLLFFPVLVAFVFEYYQDSFTNSRFENLAENMLFGMLLFVVISLIKQSKLRTVLFIVTYTLFAFFVWIESCFFILYQVNFNPSTIYILIETNFAETKEFFSSLANKQLLLFSTLLFLPLIIIVPYLVNQLRFFSWFIHPTRAKRIAGVLITIVAIFVTLKSTDLINQNLPYLLVKASAKYSEQTKIYSDLNITDKVGNFKNSIRKRNENSETFVIVLGESHTSQKMSLYGYDRPTNPKLQAIKDELILFDKVISPYTTIKSLERALTLGNYEDSTAINKGSIIQLFNSVGFKTFWLSNQKPLGEGHGLITEIVKAADHAEFINLGDSDIRTPYDGELLQPFKKALDDDYPKKVIFLHLLGNKIDYAKRYPETFKVFKTEEDKYQDIEDIIDAYDNATVYNDYLLNEIIKSLKEKDSESFMLYTADHGEEVYQTRDTYGHSENEASKPMYDIPFILWQSEQFKKSRPIRFRPYREYMIDDLFQSIAHLTNIKFDDYEAQRSVFSVYFKNRIRIIQNDIDYNKLYQ